MMYCCGRRLCVVHATHHPTLTSARRSIVRAVTLLTFLSSSPSIINEPVSIIPSFTYFNRILIRLWCVESSAPPPNHQATATEREPSAFRKQATQASKVGD